MYNTTLVNSIEKHFGYKFVDTINLIEYDYSWPSLYRRLGALKKPAWLANEKILIQHSDTEFFLNGVGFSIYNFNQAIKSLDIDPAVFVILTNHHRSTSEWNSYCQHEKNQFHVIESPLTRLTTYNGEMPRIELDCQYQFGTLIGLSRGHRVLLSNFLANSGVIENSLVSINLRIAENPLIPVPEPRDHSSHMPVFLSTIPDVRNNDHWAYDQVLTNLYNLRCEFEIKHEQKISQYSAATWADCPWYKEIFVDLVTETVYNYPYAFISEKTIRPIVLGRPFIIVGAPGTLKWLQELGFKTFSDYWDESYDNITDPNKRFHKICKTIETINNLGLDTCQKFLRLMQDILIHNQRHYLNWIDSGFIQPKSLLQ